MTELAAEPVEPEPEPDEPDDGWTCEATSTHVGAFLEPGRDAEVALIECTGEETAPHGEEAAEQGFTETPKSASLRVTVNGEVVAEHEFASWTNGWEWGGRWTLAGVLTGGTGETDAIVLDAGSWAEGGSATQVRIVSLAGGAVDDLWAVEGADVGVLFSKDGTSVLVSVQDDPDAMPGEVQLEYTGGAIHEVTSAP